MKAKLDLSAIKQIDIFYYYDKQSGYRASN